MSIQNLLGRYSTTDILLESDLHSRMLQTKLTPNLGTFIPTMKEELLAAMGGELPDCKGEILSIFDMVEPVINRSSFVRQMDTSKDTSNLLEPRCSNFGPNIRRLPFMSEQGVAGDIDPLHRERLPHGSCYEAVPQIPSTTCISLHAPGMEGTEEFV